MGLAVARFGLKGRRLAMPITRVGYRKVHCILHPSELPAARQTGDSGDVTNLTGA
jgi:hypothetical protein